MPTKCGNYTTVVCSVTGVKPTLITGYYLSLMVCGVKTREESQLRVVRFIMHPRPAVDDSISTACELMWPFESSGLRYSTLKLQRLVHVQMSCGFFI
jgi:hypothetical protein